MRILAALAVKLLAVFPVIDAYPEMAGSCGRPGGVHLPNDGGDNPSDGGFSRCAETQGHKQKRIVPGKQAGLTHRPDTAEGMARRTDHLDLVAAVHSEPTLRRELDATSRR